MTKKKNRGAFRQSSSSKPAPNHPPPPPKLNKHVKFNDEVTSALDDKKQKRARYKANKAARKAQQAAAAEALALETAPQEPQDEELADFEDEDAADMEARNNGPDPSGEYSSSPEPISYDNVSTSSSSEGDADSDNDEEMVEKQPMSLSDINSLDSESSDSDENPPQKQPEKLIQLLPLRSKATSASSSSSSSNDSSSSDSSSEEEINPNPVPLAKQTAPSKQTSAASITSNVPHPRPKTLAQTLVGSNLAPEDNPLRGVVPSKVWNMSLSTLLPYLGLKSEAQWHAWVTNEMLFAEYFELLWTTIIDPQGGTGPSLQQVQTRIIHGERHGLRKFSAKRPNFDAFDAIDYYAYCVWSIRDINTTTKQGIFFGLKMNEGEVEQRVWQAMLRRKKDLTRAKTNASTSASKKQAREALESDQQLSEDLVPVSQGSLAPVPKNPAAATKRTHGLDETLSETSPASSPIAMAVARAKRRKQYQLQSSDQVMFQDNTLDESESEAEVEAEAIPIVDNFDLANAEMSDLDRVKHTKNEQDPFDIETEYGKMATGHLVLEAFNDDQKLQRLLQPPPVNPSGNAVGLISTHNNWTKITESIGDQKPEEEILRQCTEAEKANQSQVETFTDNPELQPQNYKSECQFLGLDHEHPLFEGMPQTQPFTAWQVTLIAYMIRKYGIEETRAMLVADGTGLGKTLSTLGFLQKRAIDRQVAVGQYAEAMEKYEKRLKRWTDREAKIKESGKGVSKPSPQMPTPLPPYKPILIITPQDAMTQWAEELTRNCSKLDPYIYHGDTRTSGTFQGWLKVSGLLHQNHAFFNGNEANGNKVILTNIHTFGQRHGPGELKDWRMNTKRGAARMSNKQAQDVFHEPDPAWPYYLADKFDILCVDEAHCIKNADTVSNIALKWLNTSFTVLISASIVPNRLEDFHGYIDFLKAPDYLWDKAYLDEWDVDESVNPYLLDEDHPACVLRLTHHAIEKFITGPGHKRGAFPGSLINTGGPIVGTPTTAGAYMRKVWKECMVRRTYASKNPQYPERIIGDSIPRLYNRRIICNFNDAEYALYKNVSEIYEKHLCKKIGGRIVWNRKCSRQLTLNSTWLGFAWVGRFLHAKEIANWRQHHNILQRLISLFHKEIHGKKQYQELDFILPEDDAHISEWLAILCRGAPKIRGLLRHIMEIVVMQRKKMIIWCGLPATQLLVYAIFQALDIDAGMYSSDLHTSERQVIVQQYNYEPNKCKAFIGSWYCGSVALNLQFGGYHVYELDPPPTFGHRQQGRGRVRRMGLDTPVECFELVNERSFQNRVIQNTLNKALPGIMAELSLNIEANGIDTSNPARDDVNIELDGDWYLVNGQLLQAPDDRIKTDKDPLTPGEFVAALLEISQGARLLLDEIDDDGNVVRPQEFADEEVDMALASL